MRCLWSLGVTDRESSTSVRGQHRLMKLVRQEAKRIARQFPPGAVELEDLISHGTIAMLEAERRFDHGQGSSIEAYARIRIRGGIIDGIRGGLGTFGRRAYREFKAKLASERRQRDSAEEAFGGRSGAALDVSYTEVADYAKTLLETHPCMPVIDSPEDTLSQAEVLEALRAAIASLNTGEVRVVRAIYDFSLNDNSGAKLARRMGLNRSQICRKHQKILKKLRRKIRLVRSATLSGS